MTTITFPARAIKPRKRPPVPKPSAIVSEQDQAYYSALELVELLDEQVTRGTRKFYDFRGRLLTTLDQVVNAILRDELILDKRPL